MASWPVIDRGCALGEVASNVHPMVYNQSPSALALTLPDDLTFEQWKSVGRSLCSARQKLNWQIGDWWAFGDHRYGERALGAAEGVFGLEFKTLANAAAVCRSFETSRRREHLSFSHHVEVAPLPADIADKLLAKAEAQGLSTRDLRKEAQAFKRPSVRSISDTDLVGPRPDLAEALQMIVELCEALEEHRELTEREIEAYSEASAYLDTIGHWSERDRAVLSEMADRRDWLRDAQERFPNRTVPALQCMMQKVRAELDVHDVDTPLRDNGAMVAALSRAGLRP